MKLEKKNVKADAKPNMKFTVIDEVSIRDKIYEVRGVKVMLDFELAEIYGYTTKAFNQQVKNNIEVGFELQVIPAPKAYLSGAGGSVFWSL